MLIAHHCLVNKIWDELVKERVWESGSPGLVHHESWHILLLTRTGWLMHLNTGGIKVSFGGRNYLYKISCCPKCAGCGLGVTVPCWRLDGWQGHWLNCSLPICTWHPDLTRHHCPPDQDNSVPGLDIDGFPSNVLVRGCLLTAKDNEECSSVMCEDMALLDTATESYRIPLCRILIVLAGWTITPQALCSFKGL